MDSQGFPNTAEAPATNLGGRAWPVLAALVLLPLGLQLIWLVLFALGSFIGSGYSHVGEAARLTRWEVVIGVELGAVLWVTRWLRNREGSLADVGLKVEWFGRELVLGVMAGTLIWFAGSVPSWVLDLVFGYQVPGVQPVFALGVGSPFQILLIAVIAFGEEVLWRGYAITELHRHYRLSVSVFVAVAGYGAFYLSQAVYTEWISVPWALWVGGSLSLLYLWRRSLVAPIIARWIVGYLG